MLRIQTIVGERKSPNNIARFFFDTVHFLQKDLRFEHVSPEVFLARAPSKLGMPLLRSPSVKKHVFSHHTGGLKIKSQFTNYSFCSRFNSLY